MDGLRARRRSRGMRRGIERRRTARLTLRRPTRDDSEALIALHVDPANYTHAPDGPHSREQAAELVHRFLDGWARHGIGYWIVERDGELAGVAGVSPTMLDGRRCLNLYYRFVPAARGQGIAAEATREALAVAAERLPDRPVIVRTRPGNDPARRLAESIGLTRRPELDADGFVVYAGADL